MLNIAQLTFKDIVRDKVFRGILMAGFLFLIIPSVSTLSMRQVTELSLTLSLSLISFILLLLSIFLGGTSLWKDIDRRYANSVLGLPITRGSYVLGRFAGVAAFTFLTALLLGAVGCLATWHVSGIFPPDRPIVWLNVFLSIIFTAQEYILLMTFAFLFSTFSTSFFLPIFGTISTFLVGSASQQVYEFIRSASNKTFSPAFSKAVTVLYYLLPNFSAFDLKANAIYGVALSLPGMAMTFAYFIVYSSLVLTLSIIIFSRREIQ